MVATATSMGRGGAAGQATCNTGDLQGWRARMLMVGAARLRAWEGEEGHRAGSIMSLARGLWGREVGQRKPDAAQPVTSGVLREGRDRWA